MKTLRYSVVSISLFLIAATNLTVEGQSLSWQPIAAGVNYAVADGALGEDVFIGMGGRTTEQEWVDSWVEALYTDSLHGLHVRHLYSVKGLIESYTEIGTLELARHLVLLIQSSPESKRIIVAGHSAGGAAARALFHDLYEGANVDSTLSTDAMVFYFELDSGRDDPALTETIADRLGHIYGVYAFLPSMNLYSSRAEKMIALGEQFGSRSSSVRIDASESGCLAAPCLHMTMINRKPYQPESFDERDYNAINPDHPVQTEYLDELPDDTGVDEGASLPTGYSLCQNYPNPFNPTTAISYDLPWSSGAMLTVFDVLGRQIRELASGAKPAGRGTGPWARA